MQKSLYDTCPVWLQNAGISLYGFYLKKKRYSGIYKQLLNEIEECGAKSRSEVRAIQNDLFLKMIQHCFENVPFYRNSFRKHGLLPKDIKDIGDIDKLPILEKSEVQKNPAEFLADRCHRNIYWTNNTSGSTGTPLSISMNESTYKLYTALLVDFEQTLGIALGDRRATFAGRMVQQANNLDPPFWRCNKAENQMLFSSYHLTIDTVEAYRTALEGFCPAEIIGYPSSIYSFVTLAKINRKDQMKIGQLKAIITNSETLFEWQKEEIQNFFKVEVFDYYGTAENLIFAEKCREKRYHPNPLLGIAEVDPNANEGGVGDIIATTLTNKIMPLIRYRIGDTIEMRDETCQCGSNYQVIQSILGRNDDNIITRDGRLIGRLDHIFKGLSGINECQIIQESYDRIHLKVVPNQYFAKEIERELTHNLRERIGLNVSVEIELVKKIERTKRGKFKGVVSKVKSNLQGSSCET